MKKGLTKGSARGNVTSIKKTICFYEGGFGGKDVGSPIQKG